MNRSAQTAQSSEVLQRFRTNVAGVLHKARVSLGPKRMLCVIESSRKYANEEDSWRTETTARGKKFLKEKHDHGVELGAYMKVCQLQSALTLGYKSSINASIARVRTSSCYRVT